MFGTYYNITYRSSDDLSDGLAGVFARINRSLSTFDEQSTISRINRNEADVVCDSDFVRVFDVAQRVYEASSGAFDITVAPLVNLWGFGYDPSDTRSDAMVDSVRAFVGFDKVLMRDGVVSKLDSRLKLDASAIAKGYGCDEVARYLEANGATDYLVEIGGELALRGVNPRGGMWHVGINKAVDDSTQRNNEIQHVVALTDCGVATSGNYRQFYVTKERRVSHTIDPRTGYPADSNVLSATVVAKDCMVADAYATAMMVIGDTAAIASMVAAAPDSINYFLIIRDNDGKHVEVSTIH